MNDALIDDPSTVVVIGFESPDLVYVMEGESVTVTVQLTGKTAIDIVVYLTTQDGTANGEWNGLSMCTTWHTEIRRKVAFLL